MSNNQKLIQLQKILREADNLLCDISRTDDSYMTVHSKVYEARKELITTLKSSQ